jgi:transposase InsO family protein
VPEPALRTFDKTEGGPHGSPFSCPVPARKDCRTERLLTLICYPETKSLGARVFRRDFPGWEQAEDHESISISGHPESIHLEARHGRRALGLQLRNKTPMRVGVKAKPPEGRCAATRPNETWAMDTAHNHLPTGRMTRILTVFDTVNRFSPLIDPRFTYRSENVVEPLDRTCGRLGYSRAIRLDQGTEFVSRTLDLWAYTHDVTLDFSRTGKSTDNAFIEAFSDRFRAERLNAHGLLTLADASENLEGW